MAEICWWYKNTFEDADFDKQDEQMEMEGEPEQEDFFDDYVASDDDDDYYDDDEGDDEAGPAPKEPRLYS